MELVIPNITNATPNKGKMIFAIGKGPAFGALDVIPIAMIVHREPKMAVITPPAIEPVSLGRCLPCFPEIMNDS